MKIKNKKSDFDVLVLFFCGQIDFVKDNFFLSRVTASRAVKRAYFMANCQLP